MNKCHQPPSFSSDNLWQEHDDIICLGGHFIVVSPLAGQRVGWLGALGHNDVTIISLISTTSLISVLNLTKLTDDPGIILNCPISYFHDPRRVHYKMFFSVLYVFGFERLRVGPGIF